MGRMPGTVVPEEMWEQRVVEDAIMWQEYGCPFDARARLPAREYQAHLALITGQREKAAEDARRARRGS